MQDYRLSPQGVLAKRDTVRTTGWTQPHWKVIDVPAGEIRHCPGQLLVDQAVATWDVLRRGHCEPPRSTRYSDAAARALAEALEKVADLQAPAAGVLEKLLAEVDRELRRA